MTETTLPINEVAQRFGIRASALRYYEEIGLLVSSVRRSNGRRYYGPADMKKLVLIQLLQDTGRLSLDEIREILASETRERNTRAILSARIAILNEQIRSAEAAKKCLEYRLSCPRKDPFDGCPVLAEELSRRLESADASMQVESANHDGDTLESRERFNPVQRNHHGHGSPSGHCIEKHFRDGVPFPAENFSSNGRAPVPPRTVEREGVSYESKEERPSPRRSARLMTF